jgi:predicted 2-oxoglutarate/Fe(II)-dependent dioxygenase YbiX
MNHADLLRRLGIYVNRQFLPPVLCDRFSRTMASARGEVAEIYAGAGSGVNTSIRRTREIMLPADMQGEFQSRLAAAMPSLTGHFARPLTISDDLAFLVYEPGDFFKPHRDRASRDAAAGGNETHRRRVSVVVFLNRQASPPGDLEYAGGDLTLFRLIDDPAWRDVGFPVAAEPGMLVAFDSTTLHEVTPVTAGRRMTVVEWLL